MGKALDEQSHDAAASIQSAAQDIERWVLSAALKGSISGDRRRDIVAQADRIAKLAQAL